jgi:hypothetical protein
MVDAVTEFRRTLQLPSSRWLCGEGKLRCLLSNETASAQRVAKLRSASAEYCRMKVKIILFYVTDVLSSEPGPNTSVDLEGIF